MKGKMCDPPKMVGGEGRKGKEEAADGRWRAEGETGGWI